MSESDPVSPVPRRLLVRTSAHVAVSTVVLLAVYYALPLQRAAGIGVLGWLAVGMVGFAAIAAVQLRAILHATHPVLRAITGFGVAIPLFVLVFAATYLSLSTDNPSAFSEPLSHTDALYFTVTVFSTVGFGDITPSSERARIATTLQMVGGLVVLGVLARVVIAAVQIARQRQVQSRGDR